MSAAAGGHTPTPSPGNERETLTVTISPSSVREDLDHLAPALDVAQRGEQEASLIKALARAQAERIVADAEQKAHAMQAKARSRLLKLQPERQEERLLIKSACSTLEERMENALEQRNLVAGQGEKVRKELSREFTQALSALETGRLYSPRPAPRRGPQGEPALWDWPDVPLPTPLPELDKDGQPPENG